MSRGVRGLVLAIVLLVGLFLSKLCAAAVVISLPVLVAGFAAQDRLVQGLSLER